MSREVTNCSSSGDSYVFVLSFGAAGELIQTNADPIDLLTHRRCSPGKQGKAWNRVLWSTTVYIQRLYKFLLSYGNINNGPDKRKDRSWKDKHSLKLVLR
jgi:hypothetical protein